MSEFSKKSLNPWISNNFIQKVSPTDKVTSRDADASNNKIRKPSKKNATYKPYRLVFEGFLIIYS